jgi:hypothetical protein
LISDTEFSRAAQRMISRYGAGAANKAIMNGDAMLVRGETDGLLLWLRIFRTIVRLRAKKPAEGEQVQ